MCGTHQALTPVVDVARDPRWGRVEETFGEDPFLVSRLGVAAVRGFQGDGTFHDRAHLIATLKHFAAHGQPEGGMNCAPVNVSERELREVFLAPFKAAIEEAGCLSVMASYQKRRRPGRGAPVLPLDLEALQTIAVVGPNANRSLLGGYSGVPPVDVTVLDGIRAHVGGRARVVHAEGCRITVGGAWNLDPVTASDPDEDRRLIAEAVETATGADVLALGGNEQTSREAWSRDHMSDRTRLDLVGLQNELAQAMLATGKPVVVLLFNGRPLAIPETAETASAVLECFSLGQECGHAVVDVLSGDVNPSGRLPFTYPRYANALVPYDHKASEETGPHGFNPQWPFGHGLPHTTFETAGLRLARATATAADAVTGSVDVANTGERAGDEVVMVFVRDEVASLTPPVRRLRAFEKVALAPGERRTLTFALPVQDLAFVGLDNQPVVEPGWVEVQVGTETARFEVTTGTPESR